MNELGNKIALKRKEIGMTQNDFAARMSVTRQTVSRWESGSVLPDIDKISDIATILGVSCDYLLKDDIRDEKTTVPVKDPGRLLRKLLGKKVKLTFFSDEMDVDLYDQACLVKELEGSWLKVEADTKKGVVEKLILVSAVSSIEIMEEVE
ncbi:MAG: helix-turn-helix domain-containing protein [Lachnospiraceae bacterium]|nr:helix-turn-helix domain-containing protein [Lachnospiraceae bacterium]